MPRDDALQELLRDENSYGFYKVDGLPAVLRDDLVVQEELVVGDKIDLFNLPNGKYFVSKAKPGSKQAFTVGKITLAHIYFDDDIILKEI